MNPRTWQHALGACSLAVCAFAAVAPAHAAVISFDGVTPGTLLVPGDSISINGLTFTAGDGVGVIDTAAAFGPGVGFDLAPPAGNPGPYYVGLNDGFVRMQAVGGGTFRVLGFEFGFVSALTNLFSPGDVPGFFIAAYEDANGGVNAEAFSFGAADANGGFRFQSVTGAALGGLSGAMRVVDFFACTFDGSGQCLDFNANFSQFALDNIDIPEPGSLALALAALALTAGFSRRKA
jgi:hypothetical protein